MSFYDRSMSYRRVTIVFTIALLRFVQQHAMQMPCLSHSKDVRQSVSLCVCLSHRDTVSKRRKLESRDLHPQVPGGL